MIPPASTHGLTLPDFLGIGAQKSGTTWLHDNLRAHPGAFLPEPKEVHYFDQKFDQPLETYARKFSSAGNRVKGEITPAYGILPRDTIRFIRKTLPHLRLIFLMRNPIDRAWSHALMSLSWQVNRPFADIPEAEFLEHFRSPASRLRGDYETILDHWLAEFPPDRLFTGFFDDISLRPRELLQSVFRHLNLAPIADWSPFPVERISYRGSGHSLPEKYRAVLTDIYHPTLRNLHRRFGFPCDRWLAAADGIL